MLLNFSHVSIFAMEKLVTRSISRCLKIVIISRVSDAHEDR